MDSRIDRVRRTGKDVNPVPRIDLYDVKERSADLVQGRDRDPTIWTSVMERTGFSWFEPERLNREVGMAQFQRDDGEMGFRHHTEGQWRHPRRMAFTIRDLVTLFVTPESFHTWFEGRELAQRAARAGLHLPR